MGRSYAYTATNAKKTKKMFEETIFPRFRVPRMVISDGGTHFTNKNFQTTGQRMGSVTMLLLHITLRQVAKQKHRTNKSRTFCRRWSMRWELHGRIDYSMSYGIIEQPIKHHSECHHINLSMGRPVI